MSDTGTKTDPRVGTVLAGRYLIEDRIDAGGMAVVYKGRDEILGRDIAVKVMHPTFASDGSFVERFRAEAQNAARLSHANICTVYDYGESRSDGTPDGGASADLFIVMEYLDGTTLRTLLDRFGRLDVDTVRHVVRGVAAALDHAHSKGIIHRDVKPENVLLTPDGIVKVVDFGIARALGTHAAQLTNEHPIGTVAYVAPEQISSMEVDERADVYSLGAVTYEMLTGRHPFEGDNPQAVATSRLRDPQLNPDLTAQIDDAVQRATSLRPEDRFASPGAFAHALGEGSVPSFLTATASLPQPLPVTERTTRIDEVPRAGTTPDGVDILPFAARLRRRRSRRFKVYALVALIVAIGAIAGYAVMPKPTTVPDLKGQTLEQAKVALERDGLVLGEVNETFHDVAAEGTVVGSDPDPGVTVKDGIAVSLFVSKGPQLFDVPDVVGKPLDEAKTLMMQAGFSLTVEKEAHHDTVPKGAVISHDPDRESVRAGTSFSAVVSKGPPLQPVPNVAGTSEDKARSIIEDAGFTYASRAEFSDEITQGKVISSEPGADAMAPKGSTITAVVSKGPRPFPMPNLVGMTRAAAKQKATSMGLVIGNEYPVPGSGKAKGTIQGQNPVAGTSVRKGASIDLYYAQ
jgi:serine/threonine-protein kinase